MWRQHAACLGEDPNLWFPVQPTDPQEAEAFEARGIGVPAPNPKNAVDGRKICVGWAETVTHVGPSGRTVVQETHDGCPVAEECAVWAVATRQQTGIFGGLGADGKLKWLRGQAWGAEWDADPILDDEVPDVDLEPTTVLIRQEQNALRREFGLDVEKRAWQAASECVRCGGPIPPGHHPPDRNTSGSTCAKGVTYAKGCRCRPCQIANARRSR